MGNTLPSPKREKESEEGLFGNKYGYALADMQGWRLTMEDAYIVAPGFAPEESETHLVGVFDGHGGSEVAKFCANHFGNELLKLKSYQNGSFDLALRECFHLMDHLLQKEENFEEIVKYRAQTIVDQFELLCDIIISGRSNKFTLSQLQDVLDQANFFAVPLEIKTELITALEVLTTKQQAGPSNVKSKPKPSRAQKPKKPKKPVAPKTPKKKGTRLGRLFTRQKSDTGNQKKERFMSIESDWSEDGKKPRHSEKKEEPSKSPAPKKLKPFFMDDESMNVTPPISQKPAPPPGVVSPPPGFSSMNSEASAPPPGMSNKVQPPGLDMASNRKKSLPMDPPGFDDSGNPKAPVEGSPSAVDDTDAFDPFADDPIAVNANGEIVVIENDEEIKLKDTEHTSVGELSGGTKSYKKKKRSSIMNTLRKSKTESDNGRRKLKTRVFTHAAMNGSDSQLSVPEEKDPPKKKRIKRRIRKNYVDGEDKIEDTNEEDDPFAVAEESQLPSPPTPAPVTEAKPEKPAEAQERDTPPAIPQELPTGQFITSAGCTAITALFKDKDIYVANIGDSRAVMSRNGEALPLSEDHKPTAPKERARIYAAGGVINEQGRINGDLNLSRCVGDLRFKTQLHLSPAEQIITAEADVEKFSITDDDQFIVFACDGVWDVMTSQDVITFVLKKMIGGETSLKKIAEKLLDNCLSEDLFATKGLGGDNMTCVIIRLQPMSQIKRFKLKKKKNRVTGRGLFMSRDKFVLP